MAGIEDLCKSFAAAEVRYDEDGPAAVVETPPEEILTCEPLPAPVDILGSIQETEPFVPDPDGGAACEEIVVGDAEPPPPATVLPASRKGRETVPLAGGINFIAGYLDLPRLDYLALLAIGSFFSGALLAHIATF